MACKTCEQKEKKNLKENQETVSIKLLPEQIANGDFSGNFFFKLISFIVLVIAIPLIIVVLIGQVFLTFFFPKSLGKLKTKIKNSFMSLFEKIIKLRYNRTIKKRERDFKNKKDYDSEFVDVQVHEDNNSEKK
jgi:hypothetical protein